MHDFLDTALNALATTFSGDIGWGLARLRYPIVFLIGFILIPAVFFCGAISNGLTPSEIDKFYMLCIEFFWKSIVMGLAAVFLAFINTPPRPPKPSDSDNVISQELADEINRDIMGDSSKVPANKEREDKTS